MAVVAMLKDKDKDRIVFHEDSVITIKDMRRVAKAAAKDLLQDLNTGTTLSPEDEGFQEAVIKNLNTCLNPFLNRPKKKGLSRFCSAVSRIFRSS